MFLSAFSMWFWKLIRHFFFAIDRIVYGFIPTIYDLLISIARTSVLSQADIINMAERIYDLLAIFMAFKVIFSLIMYVVNPDDFSDKTKGVGKLTTNIIISLGLLILTPYIFRLAYQTQTIVLEDNTLANLVFGKTGDKKFLNSAGDEIAYVVMSPFFLPNVSFAELQECINLTEGNKINESCFGLKSGTYEKIDDSTSLAEMTKTSNGKDNSNFDINDLQNYAAGVEHENLPLMFRLGMVYAADEKNENFIIEYRYIFSTAVGVVVLLILVTFCMDVALRSVKLSFLQLIAPIPILSYVDPKSGKDGLFKKWYQMCFKTFLSLFLRLIALYFGIYIISRIGKMTDIVDGSYVTNMWIKIFIIIGTLMFVKQLPKLLEGLGIKLDGDGKFTMNPFRKMENDMLGGKIMKKPADLLAKLPTAPIRGIGTLGKKTIGGIDAARSGKGFKQGWNRTHGNLYNNFYKKLDEWAPDSAEIRKNERLGREEIGLMKSNWHKGEEVARKLNSKGLNFSSLDGKNTLAYTTAGFSGQFLESKKNVDYNGERLKLLNKLNSAASINPGGLSAAIDEVLKEKDDIKDYEKYGINLNNINTTSLSKEIDTQQKKNSGLEKVHESMRKQFHDQAMLEDQIKFTKYNPEDPVSGDQSIFYTKTSDDEIIEESVSQESVSQESKEDDSKRKEIINKIKELESQIEAAKNQLNNASSDSEKIQIRRFIARLEGQLVGLKRQLNN